MAERQRSANPPTSRNEGPIPQDDEPPIEPVLQVIKEDNQAVFKPEVVGYFHPDLASTYGKDNIVHNGKETMYGDIHAFVDRFKDMLPIYGSSAIRANLVKCL